MAEAREAQLLVVLSLLDEKCNDDVLLIFESQAFAAAAFDSMIKKSQIHTEAHNTQRPTKRVSQRVDEDNR